jgi:hypothetical protein
MFTALLIPDSCHIAVMFLGWPGQIGGIWERAMFSQASVSPSVKCSGNNRTHFLV